METRLKDVRQARGWSQLRLIMELERVAQAHAVALPNRASLKTQVSRWENGHVVPHEPYASLLAEVYGLPLTELELPHGRVVLPAPPRPSTATLSCELLGCLDGLLGEYAKTDNAVGPGPLIGVVAQHLAELEQLALTARAPLQRSVLGLCSRYAEFAGWLRQDAGDLAEAERWTDRALDFIEGVQDEPGRAYILMRKSAIAGERREHARSVTLAAAACRGGDAMPSHLKALVFRQLAIAQALASDAYESARAVDVALLAAEAEDELANPALAYCTPGYVLMEAGVAAARLGNYELAVARLGSASSVWPSGFERDRGLCLARLALAEAARGNLDGACGVGHSAVDLAAVTGSARTRAVLRSLDRRLASHGRLTVVSNFRSYLRAQG
jgi:transcriptional regulator with XRE-family HTH domain